MNAATFRCTCVYLKNPHLLGVSLGEQSNEIETSFLRFKSFTLAAKLKQKSFVARATAEEQPATGSTVIHSRQEMKENENNYKVDGLL